MSHTNTDTIKQQRGSQGGEEGGQDSAMSAGQPFFKNRIHLTIFNMPTFHHRKQDIWTLCSVTDKIPAGVPQGSKLETPKFYFFVFFLLLLFKYSYTESIHHGRKHTDYFNMI